MKQFLTGLGLLGGAMSLGRKKRTRRSSLDAYEPYVDEMLRQYLKTALWSSDDGFGNPLDRDYDISDIAQESVDAARKDVTKFIDKAGDLLDDVEPGSAGHDFWLTRHHHGAGFWDGDYPEEVGKKLTDLSHTFRELWVSVDDDDGKIYFG